jgi:hypothetical protein
MLLPSARPIFLNCAVQAFSAAARLGLFFFSTSPDTLPRQMAIAFCVFCTYFTPSVRTVFWHLSRLFSAGPFGTAHPGLAAKSTSAARASVDGRCVVLCWKTKFRMLVSPGAARAGRLSRALRAPPRTTQGKPRSAR